MNQANWYAAYTYPRHEKKVLSQLLLRGIESFLPSYRAHHRWRNGCTAEVELPLFPGYLFVRIPLQDRMCVLQVPSLVSLVGFAGLPAALPNEDIEALKTVLAHSKAEPHAFLQVGDRVRIKTGCLAGIEGILLRRASGFRFVLNVELIRQAASVEVSASDVVPVVAMSQTGAGLTACRSGSRPC